jgi:antirestriction protein ArdC
MKERSRRERGSTSAGSFRKEGYSKAEKVQAIAGDILSAFETGALPVALAQVLIKRNIEVPSKHWTWTNRTIGILRGHVYAAGFRQWQELGRHVKQGERAFYILAPKTQKVEGEDLGTGECVERSLVVGYQPIAVFGYLQTEGTPLPGMEGESDFIEALPLVAVARDWGLSVGTYSIADNPKALGYFVPGLGIGLGTENLSTWTHELVHAADHRLGTYTEGEIASEVVAEFGGAILLACLGYKEASDPGGAYHYIEGYCKKHKRKVLSVCTELLERTCRCVAYLLDEAERIAGELPSEAVA